MKQLPRINSRYPPREIDYSTAGGFVKQKKRVTLASSHSRGNQVKMTFPPGHCLMGTRDMQDLLVLHRCENSRRCNFFSISARTLHEDCRPARVRLFCRSKYYVLEKSKSRVNDDSPAALPRRLFIAVLMLPLIAASFPESKCFFTGWHVWWRSERKFCKNENAEKPVGEQEV